MSEPLITLMLVMGFDFVVVVWVLCVDFGDTKNPVRSKDGAWVPRGTTFVAAAFVCGGLSMTLGNGRIPAGLSCLLSFWIPAYAGMT